MHFLVAAFGLFMITTAAYMVVRPAQFIDGMKRLSGTMFLYVLEVAVRCLLGGALILVSGHSRFPVLLQALGSVSIAAGVIVVLISRTQFEQLIKWMVGRFGNYVRIGALVLFLSGGFLLYAVL